MGGCLPGTQEYEKQHNYCVSLDRKSKKPYYSSLEEIDNNAVQTQTTFFYSILRKLKIAEYANCDAISGNIKDSFIKPVEKYRNHISILKIGEVCNRQRESIFPFLTCR